ncbi:MAG TPA: choline-sulfatase, partial [Verrucomicrobiales bacterium]|nr:choline-sulfatase [Verrucomicrobiales bacterium]
NTLWDRSTRVPLIFAGPGVAKSSRCSKPAELLDLYPTLSDLAGLPQASGMEGHSLLPQLKDANSPRKWPAITTHNHDNHGIRSEHWRYIRYADGSEELYDMRKDPNEWDNLADAPQFSSIKKEHAVFLPERNLKPVKGSASRILVYEEGFPVWEGQRIHSGDLIPGK